METKKFQVRNLLKDKKFWVASFIIAWAAALQGHVMWLKRQDSFKQKFGTTPDPNVPPQQEELTQNQKPNTDSSTFIFEEVAEKGMTLEYKNLAFSLNDDNSLS